jgi:peroxiredoxin
MKKVIIALLCAATLVTAQLAPRRAPGFCLIDTTGQWRDLADYRGKVVVVEFMQTTCAHCAVFTPILADLTKKYGDKLQVISIALSPDTTQSMMQFAKGHSLTWPLVLDQGQVAVSYVRKGEINFPTLYLVDTNGMIAKNWEYGGLTKDVFEGNGLAREIDKLLPSPSAAPAATKKK